MLEIIKFLLKGKNKKYEILCLVCILMLFISLNLVIETIDKDLFIKISIIDLAVKLLFLQGSISNSKYLIFLPIPYKVKLILFISSPLFSYVNIFALLGLFHSNIDFVLISIINTLTVYFVKIKLKNIYRYLMFYIAYYFLAINDYRILQILLFLCFITIEFYINKKYLKINKI